jgi:hypothetical protein
VQTNATIRHNVTRVVDMIEWHLKRMTAANGFSTDGLTVDRLRDTRKQPEDITMEYRADGTLVRICVGDSRKIVGRSANGGRETIGNARSKTQQIKLWCFQRMTDEQSEAGVSLDQMQIWLAHDIEWALAADVQTNFGLATAGLNAIAGPWGDVGSWGLKPSCFNLGVTDVKPGPSFNFPSAWQLILLQFDYDEYGPQGLPGFAG